MRTILIFVLAVAIQVSRADVIECDNGDRYNGKVLSMDEKTVKLQNDIAGTLTIPRTRIVGISFRQGPAPAPLATQSTTNRPALDPNQLKFDAASIARVQNEFLATATPEATQMFQELVRGVQSGQLNLGDVRAQAATVLKELREAKQDLGNDDFTGILDSYEAILENFMRQTTANPRPPASKPARPQPKAPLTQE